MSQEERLKAIRERLLAFCDLAPEDQSPELYRAHADISDLLYYLEGAERELRMVKAQSDERAARAWDKGYGAGHHDGRWHDTMRLSSRPREDKGRRNPYRFSGGAGCGCHGGAE
jgi:hypothetical protein